MEEYKPNSHKAKEESEKQKEQPPVEKRAKKVVSGNVMVKKKTELGKLASVFVSEDVTNVKEYIISGVLIPALKKAISDIVNNGVDMVSDIATNSIDMMLFGEINHSKKHSPASKISYNSCFKGDRDRRDRYQEDKPRMGYDFDDISFDNRGDAEEVLSTMDDIIDQYDMVRVADMYDLAGMTCKYTDYNYGWTDIHNASIVRSNGRYRIKMPRALPLK